MARMRRTRSPRAGLAGNRDTAWGFLGDLKIDPVGPGNPRPPPRSIGSRLSNTSLFARSCFQKRDPR